MKRWSVGARLDAESKRACIKRCAPRYFSPLFFFIIIIFFSFFFSFFFFFFYFYFFFIILFLCFFLFLFFYAHFSSSSSSSHACPCVSATPPPGRWPVNKKTPNARLAMHESEF